MSVRVFMAIHLGCVVTGDLARWPSGEGDRGRMTLLRGTGRVPKRGREAKGRAARGVRAFAGVANGARAAQAGAPGGVGRDGLSNPKR